MAESGEDLVANLANYKIQLQQVDAALTTDPENEDLVKLKHDLMEVISLTEDLVQSQVMGAKQHSSSANSNSRHGGRSWASEGSRSDRQEVKDWLSAPDWKTGDKCKAPWTDASGDQQYYPATIDEVLDDGSCSVIFDKYGSTEVTQLIHLRPIEDIADEDDDEHDGGADSTKPKTKKDLSLAQREYKKKKAQKKAQRLKQHEDEREMDKNKWISFNAKVFSKTNKGRVKKSIFASPDSLTTGKVGVGTCGVSGRPMTKFTHIDKHWKK